jgi:hypothetical protein
MPRQLIEGRGSTLDEALAHMTQQVADTKATELEDPDFIGLILVYDGKQRMTPLQFSLNYTEQYAAAQATEMPQHRAAKTAATFEEAAAGLETELDGCFKIKGSGTVRIVQYQGSDVLRAETRKTYAAARKKLGAPEEGIREEVTVSAMYRRAPTLVVYVAKEFDVPGQPSAAGPLTPPLTKYTNLF